VTDSPATVPSPAHSSPAKGRAAPTAATTESTITNMIAGATSFLVSAMVATFSLRVFPCSLSLTSEPAGG
jgi:hypothetical protein